MNKTQDSSETRSSKKNLRDRVLLASWVAVYSLLLLGFGILKRLEGGGGQSKVGAAAK